ncbi:hypothetical protein Nmel_007756, partial [Mimus melanotis]
WQRDCGIRLPSDPLVFALKKNYKAANQSKLKRCCSTCSNSQKCRKSNQVYRTTTQKQNIINLFKLPPRRQEEDESSEGTPPKTPPSSPISSRTKKQ